MILDMSSKYNVGVGVGVWVFDNNQVLIQQRQDAHGQGTWAPPGGKVDHSENPVDTAIREVKEETDVDITDVTFIGFTNDVYNNDDLHYITLWYVSRKTANSPPPRITEPNKCSDMKWLSLKKLEAIMEDQLFLSVQNLLASPKMMEEI